jgi:hypothetical protein
MVYAGSDGSSEALIMPFAYPVSSRGLQSLITTCHTCLVLNTNLSYFSDARKPVPGAVWMDVRIEVRFSNVVRNIYSRSTERRLRTC